MSQPNTPNDTLPDSEWEPSIADLFGTLELNSAPVADSNVPPVDHELLEVYVRGTPPLTSGDRGMVLWLVTRNETWKRGLADAIERVGSPTTGATDGGE
jgi:hypothetical protein